MSDTFDIRAMRAAFAPAECAEQSAPIHPGEILREDSCCRSSCRPGRSRRRWTSPLAH